MTCISALRRLIDQEQTDQDQEDRRDRASRTGRVAQRRLHLQAQPDRQTASATIPNRIDATKPTNGLDLAAEVGARAELQQQPGKDDALQRDIAGRQTAPRAGSSPSSCAISGTRPNTIPCSDSQRMQAPIRLVPSRAKHVSKPSAWIVFSSAQHRGQTRIRMKPTADRVAAPTMNCGTFSQPVARHRRLDHADHDARARPCRAASRRRQSHGFAAHSGTTSPTSRLPTSHSFSAARVLDEAEIGSAVVEHHDLVDHRQLEVRRRVVDRDPAVLDQREDQQGQRRPAPGPAGRRAQDGRGDRAVDRGQRERAGDARQHRQRQQEGRLGQRREMQPRGWPPCPRSWSRCRAPPAPWRSGRARTARQARQVAGKAQRRRQTAERHDEQGGRSSAARFTTGPARNTQVVTSP